MADIAAADVSAVILWRAHAGKLQNRGQRTMIDVAVKITVDPGTTDAYPTGGIPLTNLFTTGNASDTGLDVNLPIVEMTRGGYAQISDALFPATPAFFYNGGVTAASQTLVLGVSPADDGTKNVMLVQYPNEDITTNTTVTTGLATGDKDIVYTTVLRGFLRHGVTFPGIDA
jgi:hypothetical protein